MIRNLLFISVLLAFTSGCSTFEKTKNYVSENTTLGDNPLKEASRKESFTQARAEVVSARKAYEDCMSKNEHDVYNCVPERERYDAATDRYIELQRESAE